jgi:hypothetical protein
MQQPDATTRDVLHWKALQRVFDTSNFASRDILTNFAAYVRRRDMVRFLAHYELFKHIIDLPGCIVEAGVFRGASFFTWAKLMETFCPGDRSRKVFGFDHFKGLHGFVQEDGMLDEKTAKVEGGYGSSLENIQSLIQLHNNDNLIPGVERCRLINGDIRETLPAFLESHPGMKIALLHLDMDIYEPTKFALEQLYDSVLPSGVVVLDEYGLIPWAGETRAVDEFLASRSISVKFRKFPFTQTPHAYFVKE